jgi:hypothetical protein
MKYQLKWNIVHKKNIYLSSKIGKQIREFNIKLVKLMSEIYITSYTKTRCRLRSDNILQ